MKEGWVVTMDYRLSEAVGEASGLIIFNQTRVDHLEPPPCINSPALTSGSSSEGITHICLQMDNAVFTLCGKNFNTQFADLIQNSSNMITDTADHLIKSTV